MFGELQILSLRGLLLLACGWTQGISEYPNLTSFRRNFTMRYIKTSYSLPNFRLVTGKQLQEVGKSQLQDSRVAWHKLFKHPIGKQSANAVNSPKALPLLGTSEQRLGTPSTQYSEYRKTPISFRNQTSIFRTSALLITDWDKRPSL